MIKQIANAHPIPTPSFDEDDTLFEFSRLAKDVSSSVKKKSDTKTKKTKKKRMASVKRRDRKRRRFSFWLEGNKSDQIGLMEWINELKHQRQFVTVIRFALWLYQDLLAGRTDMLYETFPNLIPPPPPPPVAHDPDKIDRMQKKIDELQDRVNSLTDIVIKQNAPGAVDMGVKMAGQGAPKMLTNNKAAPVVDDDDDDLVIRRDESSGARAAENFLKSAFALNGMSYEGSKQ